MKSVCIVGAGPAGLVAAKTFLNVEGFSVTVFEAADRVGGMWRGRRGEVGDKCSPEMRTNLSRFTVAFPELPWSAVDLSSEGPLSPSSSLPMFPKARQVGQYLETYSRKFNITQHVMFNTSVTSATPLEETGQWKITSKNMVTHEQTETTFDYLIVASGFFGKPSASFAPTPQSSTMPIQHSSSFRNLSELTKVAGKIAVIGGGISGAEAAAEAAFQISNSKSRPNNKNDVHQSSTIYHIINRPFYALPRYLPQEPQQPGKLSFAANSSPNFLPLDLVLYNLSRRGGGTISAAISTVPPEKASKGHEFLRGVINGDQSEGSSGQYEYNKEQTQYPAYTAITDTYAEFVRSGIIVQVQGWVDGIQNNEDGTFNITLSQKEPWSQAAADDLKEPSTITNVVGVIEATGYRSNLDYLDADVKEKLDYDPNCPRIPIILTRGSIFAPNLPTLAFVGFYEGPYWGVMDMQARLVAQTWMSQLQPASSKHEHKTYGRVDAEDMREALKGNSLQVPQFWMMDYIGLLEELARDVGLERNDRRFGSSLGPAFPSRYISDDNRDASQVIDEVVGLIEASRRDHRFVAAAVFRGLQGTWTLERRIESRNSMPGGVFSGVAQFHPRIPTSPNYSSEYLYIEGGKFTPLGGDSRSAVPATRRYIYRYNEHKDQITAWFTEDDGMSPGLLFNKWEFQRSMEGPNHSAIGHHWCDPDTYRNFCEFAFQGARLDRFGIKYEVCGPNKDYNHQSWYERPKPRDGTC